MTDAEIVNSEAFRAINCLLDEKAVELANNMNELFYFVDRARNGGSFEYTVRTSQEVDEGAEATFTLPFNPSTLFGHSDLLKKLGENIERLDREIRELQRFKLRLLNDYDFTHGDVNTQKMVFGEVR